MSVFVGPLKLHASCWFHNFKPCLLVSATVFWIFGFEFLALPKSVNALGLPDFENLLTSVSLSQSMHRVCCILDDLKGDHTEPVTLKTECCEPDPPLPPKLVQKTKTSLSLKWNVSDVPRPRLFPPCYSEFQKSVSSFSFDSSMGSLKTLTAVASGTSRDYL